MLAVGFNKSFKRTIMGLLDFIGKGAGRQLAHPQMILKAEAAISLSRTGLVAAVAVRPVVIMMAAFLGCHFSLLELGRLYHIISETGKVAYSTRNCIFLQPRPQVFIHFRMAPRSGNHQRSLRPSFNRTWVAP